jgi:adenylate kinase family enzyme
MQPKEETRRGAVLLMGPTGSGKTPLGQLMESRGLWGFPCLHFDFGHELRNSVVSPGTFLSGDEREFVTHVLNAGALLDDEHFPLALKIFEGFINSHNPDRRTIIVLNGMPRHTGQAERMQELVRMLAVVSLECPPETVVRRIRLGGQNRRFDWGSTEKTRVVQAPHCSASGILPGETRGNNFL